jgi:hypothetical protein
MPLDDPPQVARAMAAQLLRFGPRTRPTHYRLHVLPQCA